jgi:ATP-binding protein involved in chromosome partitioning
VPLLGKIPLQEELRLSADEGTPLVLEDPDAPAAQALMHTARGLISVTPQQIGVLQQEKSTLPPPPPAPAGAAPVTGVALPMAR